MGGLTSGLTDDWTEDSADSAMDLKTELTKNLKNKIVGYLARCEQKIVDNVFLDIFF